ncbi:HEAT repeat domain-containing protein [Thioclava sp. GXIMD4216]|uniref:HEAT repeat domain-containing protein n=1 Tax=Thioclava sp. GXIMD4216 TaxID=3131929 RepID=UPI0030D2BD07
MSDIAPERLAALNAGEIEAATLTECLAVDFARLMQASFPEIDQSSINEMDAAQTQGITRRMVLAARILHDQLGADASTRLIDHPSDTVRGWACFALGTRDDMVLATKLDVIRPLADDEHFGVREWAWLALRPEIAAQIDAAICYLTPWVTDPSARLRRFACESTRPRGVWCSHIKPLREDPARALRLLAPLRADPAKYVQDSVGNWLNDAAKDRPDWVRALCRDWENMSPAPETARIVKRALRNIGGA